MAGFLPSSKLSMPIRGVDSSVGHDVLAGQRSVDGIMIQIR
jgi:hypothetical protein